MTIFKMFARSEFAVRAPQFISTSRMFSTVSPRGKVNEEESEQTQRIKKAQLKFYHAKLAVRGREADWRGALKEFITAQEELAKAKDELNKLLISDAPDGPSRPGASW